MNRVKNTKKNLITRKNITNGSKTKRRNLNPAHRFDRIYFFSTKQSIDDCIDDVAVLQEQFCPQPY